MTWITWILLAALAVSTALHLVGWRSTASLRAANVAMAGQVARLTRERDRRDREYEPRPLPEWLVASLREMPVQPALPAGPEPEPEPVVVGELVPIEWSAPPAPAGLGHEWADAPVTAATRLRKRPLRRPQLNLVWPGTAPTTAVTYGVGA